MFNWFTKLLRPQEVPKYVPPPTPPADYERFRKAVNACLKGPPFSGVGESHNAYLLDLDDWEHIDRKIWYDTEKDLIKLGWFVRISCSGHCGWSMMIGRTEKSVR